MHRDGEARRHRAGHALLREIDALCIEKRIWFDRDHRLILYTPAQLKRRSDFLELQRVLDEAATRLLHLGDREAAYKVATMGVSIGQHLLRTRNGYCRHEEWEAGSVDCRLVRAAVLGSRGDLDAARREIDLERHLAEGASGPEVAGAWEAYLDLEKARSRGKA